MKDKREIRAIEIAELEIRADEGEPEKIVGYAAVFDKLSVPLWGFREKIAPGAFSNTIKNDDIRALWNHDSKYVLGRNKAGTLELSEDAKGLRMVVTPPDTQWARDLVTSIKRGDVNQMSFGFETVREEWDNSDSKQIVRTLLEVRLFDVSVVTYPAYPQTSVKVRTVEDAYNEYLAAKSQEAGAEDEAARAAAQESLQREQRERLFQLLEKEI
jgi:HK97 family phage prohead protease